MNFEQWFDDLSYALYRRFGWRTGIWWSNFLIQHKSEIREQWEALYGA